MTKARKHKGGFAESMATVQPVTCMDDLVALINASSAFGGDVAASQVHVTPYGFDKRCGWDTHLVTIDGHGVWGMTDGPA